jgi:hypothetical protein
MQYCLIILTFLGLLRIPYNYKGSILNRFENVTLEVSSGDSRQNQKKPASISNPLHLDYVYYKIVKLQDGTSANMFIEKGKTDNKDGEYAWTKMVPFYASSEVKYSFEYQMHFTEMDMIALVSWLKENMHDKLKVAALDNPGWYDPQMTLIDIFRNCKIKNQNITLSFYCENPKRIVILVLDAGSEKTHTIAEIGLVYMFYNE